MTAQEVEQPTNRQIIDEIRALYDDFTARMARVEARLATLEAGFVNFEGRLSGLELLVERKAAAEAVAAMSPEDSRRYGEAGLAAEIEEARR